MGGREACCDFAVRAYGDRELPDVGVDQLVDAMLKHFYEMKGCMKVTQVRRVFWYFLVDVRVCWYLLECLPPGSC